MQTFYYGLAAAGIVATLGLYLLCRTKKQTIQQIQITTNQSKISKSTQTSSISHSPEITQNKIQQKIPQVIKIKKPEQLQTEYKNLYISSFRLKSANSIHSITAIDFKGSKLLLTTTKNQMILFNLKNWKKDTKNSTPQKYFVSLDNNGASAVCIGQNYYYAALTFDKTIVYYEFKGEGGVYFKQASKFSRNILKSNASSIHVPKNQNYIITTGTGADTVIDVWSMKGEKLFNLNSFQIQHYGISCGFKDILIRGWTSQIKIFGAIQQKDGTFKKLQKRQHLAHQQSPLSSAICNRDMYAMSISKHYKVKVWSLNQNDFHRTHQANIQSHPQFTALQVNKCNIHTFQPAIGHFKTIIVISHSNGFILTDTSLKILQKIDGIQVKDIYINGTQKSVILGVVNNQGIILLWNLTKQLDNIQEITI